MKKVLRDWALRTPFLRQLAFYKQEAHARQVTNSRELKQLTRYVWQQGNGKVCAGPFAGLKYLPYAHGSMLLPKLLGSYEKELHELMNQLMESSIELVVDIGAAEGYYAVGLAFRKPEASVIAYEASVFGRRELRKLARLNNTADRVKVCGLASVDSLKREIQPGGLVICDVEGAEDVLLNPDAIPALRQSTILFEAHDDQDAGRGERVAARFADSHRVLKVAATARTAMDWTAAIALDLRCWPKDAGGALNEFRHSQQYWYFLQPTQPAACQKY